MEELPKDIQEKIINELPAADFVRLCGNKDVVSAYLCADQRVWYRRLKKDFNFMYLSEEQSNIQRHINYKNLYLEVFNVIQKTVEDTYSEILDSLGENFVKYLNPLFRKDLTDRLYSFFLEGLQNKIYLTNLIFLEIKDMLPSKYKKSQTLNDSIYDKILIIKKQLDNLREVPTVPLLPALPKAAKKPVKSQRFNVDDFML